MKEGPETTILETDDERLFFRQISVDPEPLSTGDLPSRAARVPERPTIRKPHFRHSFSFRTAWAAGWSTALRRETGLGTPFLFLPVFMLAGVVAYFSLPAEPAAWNLASGLAVLSAVTLVPSARTGRFGAILLALLALVSGMALAQVHTNLMPETVLGSEVTTRLTGRIVSVEERANGRTRFTIDLLETERPKLRYAPSRVRVTARGEPAGFPVGGGIKGVARLSPPSGPVRPGGYDFAFHTFFDGIGANGFFLGDPQPATVADHIGIHRQVAFAMKRLRQRISAEIKRIAPGRAGVVSSALVTGEKASIPEDVTEALRVSGLAHILSISGLHMALVSLTVMATLRLCFAAIPGWSAKHPVKKYAAAGALAATGFYLFLAGAGVATQRSFAMLAIMLLALTFDRNAVTMRNLALAALIVILISPDEVTGPGFQMSFAATAALIAIYGGWRDRRRKPRNRSTAPFLALGGTVARYALGLAVTSIVAGLATGIFASYHFGRVAPYGLLTNLAAMPLVSIVVIPLAVLAVVLMPFGLHGVAFALMARGVELVITIAESVEGLSPPVATGQMPGIALLAFAAGLVLLCLFSTWLRWLSIPVFALGISAWISQELPLAVITEDARQFAIIETNGKRVRLHVNRNRPNTFVLEQWTDAYAAKETIKPKDSEIMRCESDVCAAELQFDGKAARIVYVVREIADDTDMRAVAELCALHDLVIFAKSPSPRSCPNGTQVISAQMLALNGAAEIYPSASERTLFDIRYALPGPVRPWLDHRRYSRAARNLPEWKPREKATQ
jgi:ComEC/Rec2-related protein